MNKNGLHIISAILLAGLVFFTACVEPEINNFNEPKSGIITGKITLVDVPDPAPQVFISVWGLDGNKSWQSSKSRINLDTGNYTDISWSIPVSENDHFFPSNGKFRLSIQQPDGNNMFEIFIEQTPYIKNINDNVGSLGTVSIKNIILSGSINVTYENNPIPYVEIGVDISGHEWISYTWIESPAGSNANWSLKLPSFNSETEISFRVIGYNVNNVRLFRKIVNFDPPKKAYNKDISGIVLDLGNVTETPVNVIPLVDNSWVYGEITIKDDVEWYSIDVTNGSTYKLWWNDSASGDNSKTLDIDVYAFDNNKNAINLANHDCAWDDPVSFTASSTGKVYIRVRALNWASLTGTYAIAYSSGDDMPDSSVVMGTEKNPNSLTAGTWTNGSIPSSTSGRTIWYSFNVTNGVTYYVWWDDSGVIDGIPQGTGSKTLDIKVDAYYAGGQSIFVEADSSWTTANRKSFKANSTGIVKLKVSPYFRLETGTFAITYNTTGTRPN